MFSKLLKGVLPPSTSAPAGEAQMLPDIEDKSDQLLVKNLMGTTKSQLCPFVGCLLGRMRRNTLCALFIFLSHASSDVVVSDD